MSNQAWGIRNQEAKLDSLEINSRLKAMYESHWSELTSFIPSGQGYSAPFLIRMPDEYAISTLRLMVVGQQSRKWWGENGYDALRDKADPTGYLLERYAEFNNGYGTGHKGAYCGFVHRLHAFLRIVFGSCGLVTNNLVKIDRYSEGGERNQRAIAIEPFISSIPLLENEIQILQPHVIVFLTGPNYDDRLDSTFRRNTRYPMSGLFNREGQRIRHPLLPKLSYRLWHPSGMQKRGTTESFFQSLVKNIADDIVADPTVINSL